jgi:CspA family cold shock protein
MLGTIKNLAEKGFGFITKDGAARGDKDYFFHCRALQNASFEELERGQRVEFDTEPDPQGRGDRAINVRRV